MQKSVDRHIKASNVLEELKRQNYLDRVFKDMLACIKNEPSYKQLTDVAVTHMFNTLINPSVAMPDATDRLQKKEQIAQIGVLIGDIYKHISDIISQKMAVECKPAVQKTIHNLAKSQRNKRKRNAELPTVSSKECKQIKTFSTDRDDKSDAALDISCDSVSSVHTSDLSSFDDGIVVSSEDENGSKKKICIPFKTANHEYLQGKFSKLHKIVENQQQLAREANMDTNEINSNKSVETRAESFKERPKRERKPNSKYS